MTLLKEQRNQAFIRAINRAKSELLRTAEGKITIEDILNRLTTMEAPGYFVDHTYALRNVSALLRGRDEFTPTARSRRRALFGELAEKCKAQIERNPQLSLNEALARVLSVEPASSFFLSYAQARKLYFELQRAGRFSEHRRRLRRLFR